MADHGNQKTEEHNDQDKYFYYSFGRSISFKVGDRDIPFPLYTKQPN